MKTITIASSILGVGFAILAFVSYFQSSRLSQHLAQQRATSNDIQKHLHAAQTDLDVLRQENSKLKEQLSQSALQNQEILKKNSSLEKDLASQKQLAQQYQMQIKNQSQETATEVEKLANVEKEKNDSIVKKLLMKSFGSGLEGQALEKYRQIQKDKLKLKLANEFKKFQLDNQKQQQVLDILVSRRMRILNDKLYDTQLSDEELYRDYSNALHETGLKLMELLTPEQIQALKTARQASIKTAKQSEIKSDLEGIVIDANTREEIMKLYMEDELQDRTSIFFQLSKKMTSDDVLPYVDYVQVRKMLNEFTTISSMLNEMMAGSEQLYARFNEKVKTYLSPEQLQALQNNQAKNTKNLKDILPLVQMMESDPNLREKLEEGSSISGLIGD